MQLLPVRRDSLGARSRRSDGIVIALFRTTEYIFSDDIVHCGNSDYIRMINRDGMVAPDSGSVSFTSLCMQHMQATDRTYRSAGRPTQIPADTGAVLLLLPAVDAFMLLKDASSVDQVFS